MFYKPEVSIIPLSSINLGERYRKEYAKIDELMESIKANGLIQPLAVMELPKADNATESVGGSSAATDIAIPQTHQTSYLLLAGGRRYTACTKLNLTTIPVRIYPYMENEIDIRSIELAENFDRENLSFIEEAQLVKKIHELQIAKFGKASPGISKGHAKGDTAEILGTTATTVSRNLMIADAIDSIPEVSKAKNQTEALKIIHAEREKFIMQELAKRTEQALVGSGAKVDDVRKGIIKSYLITDTSKGTKQIPSSSVDLVEMDPPYAIELRRVVQTTQKENDLLMGNNATGENAQDYSNYIPMMTEFFSEAYRILKPTGWLILWYAMDPWHEQLLAALRSVGFLVGGVPALWIKGNGNTRTPNIHLKNYYEGFLYARKEQSMLCRPGAPNIFIHNTIAGTEKIHPNEKPIELYEQIFSTFAFPSSFIVSAFAGSGNALLAAANLNHRMIGFDLNKEYRAYFIAKVMKGTPGSYRSL